jgi:hypothetical protein
LSPENAQVVQAWQRMGGIDWAALPLIVELQAVQDVERLVFGLEQIRDYFNQQQE